MAYGNYAPFYRAGYFNPMQTQPMQPMVDNQNQFAQPYQAPMQTNTQPMQNPIAQPTQASNDIIWVLNENEATSFPVAPNNTVTLWDKNEPTIYIKSVSSQGVPSMRVLDFTERVQNAPKSNTSHVCECGDKFATKDEIKDLNSKYEEIMAIVEELKANSNTKSKKAEADE